MTIDRPVDMEGPPENSLSRGIQGPVSLQIFRDKRVPLKVRKEKVVKGERDRGRRERD